MEFFFERLREIDRRFENGEVEDLKALIRGEVESAKAWTVDIADGNGDHDENLKNLYDDLRVIEYANSKLFELIK